MQASQNYQAAVGDAEQTRARQETCARAEWCDVPTESVGMIGK